MAERRHDHAVCECGHDSRQHAPTAKVRVTPRPCLVKGCQCPHFHQVRIETGGEK